MPAQAGIQLFPQVFLDSRLRGNDKLEKKNAPRSLN
jgi:hypothetical protein